MLTTGAHKAACSVTTFTGLGRAFKKTAAMATGAIDQGMCAVKLKTGCKVIKPRALLRMSDAKDKQYK